MENEKAKLKEALATFGMPKDLINSWQDTVYATPDKFMYFFATDSPEEVVVFLVEDFIDSIEYVKACFSKDINATLIKLHEIDVTESDFNARHAVKAADVYAEPEDWKDMRHYAVDVTPYFFGFLATVKPNNSKAFWTDIKKLAW